MRNSDPNPISLVSAHASIVCRPSRSSDDEPLFSALTVIHVTFNAQQGPKPFKQ